MTFKERLSEFLTLEEKYYTVIVVLTIVAFAASIGCMAYQTEKHKVSDIEKVRTEKKEFVLNGKTKVIDIDVYVDSTGTETYKVSTP